MGICRTLGARREPDPARRGRALDWFEPDKEPVCYGQIFRLSPASVFSSPPSRALWNSLPWQPQQKQRLETLPISSSERIGILASVYFISAETPSCRQRIMLHGEGKRFVWSLFVSSYQNENSFTASKSSSSANSISLPSLLLHKGLHQFPPFCLWAATLVSYFKLHQAEAIAKGSVFLIFVEILERQAPKTRRLVVCSLNCCANF